MGRNRTTKPLKRRRTMTEQTNQPQETQGKTTNPMDNQQRTKEKILRVMTGMTTGSRKSLGTYNCSLGTYNIDPKGNEDNLELSTSPNGETRRSSVQIRPTPPKLFLKKPLLSIWRNGFGVSCFVLLSRGAAIYAASSKSHQHLPILVS